MTVDQFAKRLGVHRGSVYRWESDGSLPDDDVLFQIAESGGVDVAWLRYGDRARPEEESPESAVYDASEGGEDRPGIGEAELVQMPQVVRFLKLHDGKPDERELKLATVRIWGDVLSLNGAWPDWFLVLKGRVERGEI